MTPPPRAATEADPRPDLPPEVPLSAAALTVFVTLAAMALPGGVGWLLTLPLGALGAYLWPRRALLMPLAGYLLSAALYLLARRFGAPEVPLAVVTLVYVLLAVSGLLALQPTRRLRRLLAEEQARARHDQRELEVLASLAELSSRHELTPHQAAQEALRLTRELVPLDAALLFSSGPDGYGRAELLFGPPGALPLHSQGRADTGFWAAHEESTPSFLNGAAVTPAWHGEVAGALGTWAVLPLRRAPQEGLSLVLLRRQGDGERWDLHERGLLIAAARAVRLAAERQQHLAALETIANRDALTGCLNRHAFARTLRQLDAADGARAYAVVVMDLDGFKALNDRLGHAAGDDLLCRFARAVQEAFFQRDLLFRLGGDEFALILQGAASLDPDSVRWRIAAVPARVHIEGQRWGVSVGVAQASEAPQAEAVLRLADRRMYDMKEAARVSTQRAAPTQTASAVRSAREEGLFLLGVALEARDSETQGHSVRVVQWAQALGERLGLPRQQLEAMRQGAALHDLGKLVIPDRVLLKPGKLTDEEWSLMQTHAEAGYDLARRLPFLDPHALDIIRHHHEKWDGSGYPDRLCGEQIPLLARIFAVVDVFDALTSRRPYREAWSTQAALDELQRQSGRHFDARIVQQFMEVLGDRQSPTLTVLRPTEDQPPLRS